MPDQSQGACMAVEEAACLGIVFSKKHFRGDVQEALATYEFVENLVLLVCRLLLSRQERILMSELVGFFMHFRRVSCANMDFSGLSSNTDSAAYKAAVPKENDKLTVEEMNL
jgi:salicylate hydroxylase